MSYAILEHKRLIIRVYDNLLQCLILDYSMECGNLLFGEFCSSSRFVFHEIQSHSLKLLDITPQAIFLYKMKLQMGLKFYRLEKRHLIEICGNTLSLCSGNYRFLWQFRPISDGVVVDHLKLMRKPD